MYYVVGSAGIIIELATFFIDPALSTRSTVKFNRKRRNVGMSAGLQAAGDKA